MLVLEDSIEIAAEPASVVDWLFDIEENYRGWHPDHVKWVNTDGSLDEGKTFYYEEYLHGRLYKSSCVITRVSRGDSTAIAFKGLSILDRLLGVRGSFVIEPAGGGCRVTAVISLRYGRLIPLLAGSIVRDLEKHMREEGESLKRILEESTQMGSDPN